MVSRILALATVCALAMLAFPHRSYPAYAQSDSGWDSTLAATPSTVPPGYAVSFAYSASLPANAAPDFSITSEGIDFGDGKTFYGGSAGPGEGVEGTASHVYASSGTYTAIFKAQGSDGEITTASAVIIVNSQLTPPTVVLRVDNTSPQVGDAVTITYTVTPATVANTSIASMAVSYGDGESDPLDSPSGTLTHTYTSAGAFPILIAVTDSAGEAGAASAVVQVGSP